MASASPFVQAPDQDDDQPTGPAAVLLPQQPAQADNTPVPWLPGQAPQQPQAAPVAQTAPPPLAQAPTSATNYPAIPAAPTFNQQAYQDLATKKTADATVDRKANAPKWYDRVAGGLVGFGTGFNQGASAGIAAGSKITNSRYDNALADSGRKVAADQQQMDDLTRQYGIQRNAYEDQVTGARLGTEQANDQASQADRNRAAALEQTKFNAGQTQLGIQNGYELTALNEQKLRDDQAAAQAAQRIAIERAQLGVSQQHEKFDESQPNSGSARTMMTLNQFQNLLTQRDKAYAAARKNMDAELNSPEATEGDKAATRQKYDQLAQQMQDEWGQRLAQADPEGKYAPQPPGRQPASSAPAARGMVRMQRPDGSVVQVPIQNIEKAKQLGGKVIQ